MRRLLTRYWKKEETKKRNEKEEEEKEEVDEIWETRGNEVVKN